jgi:p-hydroxybenzoate 3-monooxygenase
MQAGRLFLAGDAAHIVTPAGGKGMNLALQDAAEVTEGLLAHFRSGDSARLNAYSSTRMPATWQAVEFSHWMLQLLLADQPGTTEAAFHEGLRQARLTRLMSDQGFARAIALTYVGLDR